MPNRHAYLIMAHQEFGLLEKLLRLLDDPRNDIYLHVDRKARGFDAARFSALLQHAKLVLMPRRSIVWGGDRLIRCELALLQTAAAQGPYAYYHLLSGVDLPLQTQDAIHAACDAAPDRIYLGCNLEPSPETVLYPRLGEYHLLQNLAGRCETRWKSYCSLLDLLHCRLQKALGIDRIKASGLHYVFGDQWFSIPQGFADYVLEQRPLIRKCFYRGKTADELFMQTLAYNSPFRNDLAMSCNRLIDWDRGQPYTFRMDDLDELTHSDRFFARKFSEVSDPDIVSALFHEILMKQNGHTVV